MVRTAGFGAATVIVCLGILAVAAAGSPPVGIGLLDRLIEWPSAIGGVPELSLARAPSEDLTDAPSGDGVWFASIELGTGGDAAYGLALRFEPEPRLWIDANNNEDLGDDGGGLRPASCRLGLCVWYPRVRVTYRDEAGEAEWAEDYILRVMADSGCDEPKAYYGSCCLRTGSVSVDEGLFSIWLGDADSDGRYDDIENLTVIVDNDGDDAIAADLASPEIFYPFDALLPLGTIQIGGTLYEIDAVSPDGRRISLRISDAGLEPLRSLEVGRPAPAFDSVTLDNETVSSDRLLGSPVILHFALLEMNLQGSFSCGGLEGTIVSEMTLRVEQRLADLATLQCEEGVRVYVVAVDGPPSDERLAELDIPFPVIWDPDLAGLFRGIPLVVIGADGTILARDEAYYLYDADGRFYSMEWDTLRAYDVRRLLDSD